MAEALAADKDMQSFKSLHKMIYTVDVDKKPTPLAGLSSVQVHSSVVMCN